MSVVTRGGGMGVSGCLLPRVWGYLDDFGHLGWVWGSLGVTGLSDTISSLIFKLEKLLSGNPLVEKCSSEVNGSFELLSVSLEGEVDRLLEVWKWYLTLSMPQVILVIFSISNPRPTSTSSPFAPTPPSHPYSIPPCLSSV